VLFGGTFDPIHNAHLEIARAAADRFDLEKFCSFRRPIHLISLIRRRRRMKTAFVWRNSHVPAIPGSKFPASKRVPPAAIRLTRSRSSPPAVSRPLGFLIGADAFAEIRTWHRWIDVVRQVEFIVVTRPGARYRIPDGAVVHELAGLSLPISSSEVRASLAREDLDVAVPPAVLSYIAEHRLYR